MGFKKRGKEPIKEGRQIRTDGIEVWTKWRTNRRCGKVMRNELQAKYPPAPFPLSRLSFSSPLNICD